MEQRNEGMKGTNVSKDVQGALDRISIQENPNALSNLYENVRRHRSISEYERELLDEAVEIRMREIAPARATKLFGPRDSMARRVLQSIYDDLANTLDFTSNRVGNGVKAGGTMISGERHVDLYLSYKNEDGVSVGLTWLQDAPSADPYLRVSVRQVGGSNPGTLAEHRFETSQKNDAAACYRAELEKVIRRH